MNPAPCILTIDDDNKMLRVFATLLATEGYRVVDAGDGQHAVEEVRTRNPDVVLLDLGLPDVDGLALVPELRQHTTAPIIVVSARGQERDKIRALDAGANDYLTKPFSVPELLARIRVGLRSHAQVSNTTHSVVHFGDYTFDLAARQLMRREGQVALSPTEFKLLASLARRPNEVVTTSTLLKEAWGAAYQTKSGYVRVYMHSLRHKIEDEPTRPKYLVNENGLGYRLRTSA